MGTTSDILRQRIEFRISSRISGATDMAQFLNLGLNLIEFAAPYTWDMFFGTVTPPITGIYPLGLFVDIGKPILFNISSTKQAIQRRRPDQTWSAPPGGTPLTYDSWELFVAGGPPANARFLPALNPPIQLDYIAHFLPAPLDGTAATSVPWLDPWVDDVFVEIVEGEMKRILGMAGWQELQGRSQQKLVEVVKRYSSARENPGILEWGQRPSEKE